MRAIRLLAIILLASLAGAVSTSAQDCRQLLVDGVPPLVVRRLPTPTTLVCRQAFEALVSDQARDPLWSAERLTIAAGSRHHARRKRTSFRAEPLVPADARAEPRDYGHGYDRGHMTPAGDEPPGPARWETFYLSNVVPQTSRLNRGKWERIEASVRRLARRDGTLYVVTGPVLAAADRRTWDGAVEIPSATWKAVYDPARQLTLAWTCSNTATPICTATSVAAIEQLAGVDPFPALQERGIRTRGRARAVLYGK
jgi:endonuclease G